MALNPPTLVTTVSLPSGTNQGSALAVTPDGASVYVTDGLGISVVDTATNKVTDTITRPMYPVCSAVAPDGSVLLIGNGTEGTVWAVAVSVPNVAAGTVLTIIGGFSSPNDIVFTPDAKFAYVADTSTVKVIDMQSLLVTDTIAGFSEPGNLAINTTGTYVYVTNFNGNSLSVVETASNQIQSTIDDVYYEPGPIVVTPNGEIAYFISYGHSLVVVVDITTEQVTDLITSIEDPGALAIAPDGDYLYIGSDLGPVIGVIDTATNALVVAIEGPDYDPGVSSLVVSLNGDYLYAAFSVANGGTGASTGSVVVIDTATNAITDTIPSFVMEPGALAVTPDGTTVYVGDPFTATMIGYDSSTLAPVIGIAGLINPPALTITPDGTSVYVVNGNSTAFNYGPGYGVSVLVIDTATNAITDTIVGFGFGGLQSLAAAPDGASIYVTGIGIFVIDTATNAITGPFTNVNGALAFTPDGAYVYVAALDGPIFVIDTATNAITDTITGNTNSFGNVAVSPNGAYAYVAYVTLLVIDTATNAITASANASGQPVFTPDSAYAYIAGDNLYVVEVATSSVLFVIDDNPGIELTIAIAPDGKHFYITGSGLGLQVWQIGASTVPFIRQTPRDDNLGLGAPRQRIGRAQPSSTSSSYRQGFRGTYV